MITDILVTNYQSLRDLRLRLGRFTVVTGATSSGKSGVIRAIRLNAFNASGTSYISTGTGACQVMLNDAELGVAARITRTASRGGDAYDLIAGDERGHYTKLAGAVPEDVQRAMQLSPLNFAGQFDPPYLLTETGSEVARKLGALTNVTMILGAAQEAGRRRKRIEAELKATRDSVEDCNEQAQRFRGLATRREAIDQAEAALAQALQTEAQVTRLQRLLAQYQQAQARVEAIVLPPVIDVAGVAAAWDQWLKLRNLIQRYQQAQANTALAHKTVEQAHYAHVEAEENLHDSLVAAGTCPVCGQTVPA
jgi:hypothetical protein